MRIGLTTAIATAIAIGVVVAGGGGGGTLANIWIDSNGGTCTRSATLVAYSDAAACGTFDAANDICQSGDSVLVKTASAYAGESITGSNSRTSACTIAPESGGADIQFTTSTFVTFGVQDTTTGAQWLTIQHVQCGSDTSSFTNATIVTMYDTNHITLDDWDCPDFDFWGAKNILVDNSDWGPCGSNTSPRRVCVPRIAPAPVTETLSQGIVIEDTNFHDMWCGTGDAGECAANHTDGMALFGVDDLTLRRVKFWKNDITNIRMQNNSCGVPQGCTINPNVPDTNIVIENSWFGAPCATTTPTNCTGGTNANAFDIDNGIGGTNSIILRFNSFAQDTRPQCTGPNAAGTDCGSGTSTATFLGNIYSTNASFCGYTKVTMTYNAENHWGGSSDAVCSGTGNTMSASSPPYVTTSGIINFHLNAAYASDGLVATGCIATDIDLQSRPASNCDAGSDER